MHSLFEGKSVLDAKDFAERLRTRLQTKHGFSLGQGKTLHLIAEINGFDAWAALEKQLGVPSSENAELATNVARTSEMSLDERIELDRRYVNYIETVEKTFDRMNRGIYPKDHYYEQEPTVETIDSPYGPVGELELFRLKEQLGWFLGDRNKLTRNLLESAKQLGEKRPGSRSNEIVNNVTLLAQVLDTVLDLEPPTVPPRKIGMSVGAFAQQLFDDASWFADEEPDGDGPACKLMDDLEHVTMLEP